MTLSNLITSCHLWLRLAMLILGPLRQALLVVLHRQGVPKSATNLYIFLSSPARKTIMSKLKGRKVITKSQWEILYPPGKTETNSDLFDITLIVFLIETLTSTKPNNGNWRDKNPSILDTSIGAFCIRAREMRNYLNHFADITALGEPEFSNIWGEVVIILNGLKYTGLFNLTNLKTGSLDATNNLVLQSIVWSLDVEHKKLSNKQAQELNNLKQEHQTLADKQAQDMDSVTEQQRKLANEQEKLGQKQDDTAEILKIQINNLDEIKNQLLVKSDVNVERTMERVEKIYVSHRNLIRRVQSNMAKISCDLKKDMAELKKRTATLKNNFEENMVEPDELTCRNALTIVEKMIGDQWQILSERLNVHTSAVAEESNEAKIRLCFELAKMKIPWINLKYQLQILDREDIMEEIIKKTLLTYGLERRCIELKKRYRDVLKNWKIPAAFKGKTGRKYVKDDRRNVYVDLVVGEWEETHASDREHFLRTFHASRTNIEMKDIVQEDDCVVLIRGIAGIGKTSLIDQLVMKWAEDEILSEYKFVFKYTCRELNKLKNNTTLEKLILRHFSKSYKGMLEDLNAISGKVLLVIDGIDEYRELTELTNFSEAEPSSTELTATLYNIIVPGSLVLPNKKMIICGRPQSCGSIRNMLEDYDRTKLIEISGFNDQSIDTYIERFFVDNSDQSSKLKTSLEEIDNLQAMAHIPVYLYIICNVFASEEKLEELNTTTKLYIAACLVFLRGHVPELKEKNTPLLKLCKNKQIMEVIYTTSRLAYKSLIQKTILFNEEEFRDIDCLSAIEETGMVERHEGGEDGDVYQFEHLVLQEFLSAVHIFTNEMDVTLHCENESLRNCLPIVMGFHGIVGQWYRGPNYIKSFADYFYKRNKSNDSNSFFEKLVEDRDLFLMSYFEYQGNVADSINTDIMHKLNDISVEYHHTLKYLVHFLKTSQMHSAVGLNIRMLHGQLQTNELSALSLILSSVRVLTIDDADISADGLSILSQAIQNEGIAERGIRHGVTNEKETIGLEATNSNAESSEQINKNKLQKLGLYNCKLYDEHIMQFSKCIPHLESLDLSGSQSITPISMECISNSITEASELDKNVMKELDLNHCRITDDHMKKLNKCIPSLEILDLSGNRSMTPVSMECISNSITEASKLIKNMMKKLDLGQCGLCDDHIMKLSKCIFRLEILNISRNESLTPLSMECISNSIFEASELNENVLKELGLYDCRLNDDHIMKLSKCIPRLQSLSLSGNDGMTPTSMQCISNSIVDASKRNKNVLKKLALCGCGLCDDHIMKLNKCIPLLEILNLYGNQNITPVSMEYISNSIFEASEFNENVLKELHLSHCRLYDDHIMKLSKCISRLEVLNLSWNKNMTPASMECISIAIIEASELNNNVLKKLDLSYCRFQEDHIMKLSKCMPRLETLNLSANESMTLASMQCISSSIIKASERNKNVLKDLEMYGCNQHKDQIMDLEKRVQYLTITYLRPY